MPVGSITRGTTNTNRLRRVDRWIAEQPALLHAVDPFVVDLLTSTGLDLDAARALLPAD